MPSWQGLFRHKVMQNLAVILLSILAAFLVSVVFIAALGVNPLATYWAMLKGAFGRPAGILEILAKATPLLIIGLGISLAQKGGLANLGGDGQFYIGAICSICVGLFLPAGTPTLLVWVLAFLLGVLGGGAWGALAGFLKAFFGTSEVIITIMLNYVALYLVAWLVAGPLQAPGGIPQTRALPDVYHFPKLLQGSRAHWGILLGLAAAVLVWFIMRKTVLGYRIEAVGAAPKAAVYGGIHTKGYTVFILFLAGAFAGVAGMVEVYGSVYRVLEGITTNFGFTAMLIALLAQLNPFAVILGSLFISSLTVGANAMQIQMNVPTSIVYVVQSLIIFFILVFPGIRESVKKQSGRAKGEG